MRGILACMYWDRNQYSAPRARTKSSDFGSVRMCISSGIKQQMRFDVRFKFGQFPFLSHFLLSTTSNFGLSVRGGCVFVPGRGHWMVF
jgi:hypothetical protein